MSLRQAIALANADSGDVVVFDPALSGSTITLTQGAIAITGSMTVAGLGAKNLTISGGGTSSIFVVEPLEGRPSVTLSGLTLTKGNDGAIYVVGTLAVQDCIVTANAGGPAITVTDLGHLYLVQSVVSSNVDGGIYGDSSDISVTGSTIAGNSKTGDGAGIAGHYSSLSIGKSTITGNTATHNGGGLWMYGGSLKMTYSSVTGNSAYYFGGGIDVARGFNVYVYQSLVAHNELTSFAGSGYGGGGISLRNVDMGVGVQIVNSTVYSNFAYHNGGGIGIFDTTTGNSTLILLSTIVKNSTLAFVGNGIQAAGTPHIYNTILANNTNALYAQDAAGSFFVNHCLVTNATGITLAPGSGSNITGQDPQLGPLTVNGGPTLSMLPSVTSPVLGKGTGGLSSSVDQRGLPRFSVPDIGAVERQYPEVMIFRNGFDPP
jgi:hypothetical protein